MTEALALDDGHPTLRHRRSLFRVLLGFTVVFGAFFVPINLYAGKYLLACSEFAVVMFAAVLIPVAGRTTYLQHWALIYVLVLYSSTMYAFISPVTSITVFSWVMVMPIVAHLLLGRVLGGAISLFYLLLSAVILTWRIDTAELFDSPGAIMNIVTVTACSFIFSHVYEASREQAEHQLSSMALTDSLTGLSNRVSLEQHFDRTLRRRQMPISLVMIDLDHFKRINDDHGHATGDAVLRHMAEVMRSQIRATDLAVRLGGEEFCLLLPDTDIAEALRTSERVRAAIEAEGCRHHDVEIHVTASLGVTTTRDATITLEPMLHRADRNLYTAKFDGRNRVAG